eukprot:1834983-Prymnesium_polylepis.2
MRAPTQGGAKGRRRRELCRAREAARQEAERLAAAHLHDVIQQTVALILRLPWCQLALLLSEGLRILDLLVRVLLEGHAERGATTSCSSARGPRRCMRQKPSSRGAAQKQRDHEGIPHGWLAGGDQRCKVGVLSHVVHGASGVVDLL